MRIASPNWVFLRDEFWLGIHFTTPRFFRTLRQNIGILVLSIVAPTAVIGLYSVAQRMVAASQILTASLSRIFYASLAIAGAAGSKQAMHVTLQRLAPLLALGLAASAGLFVTAPLLSILFGEEFEYLVWYSRVLCAFPTIYAVQTAAYDALGGADQHRVRAATYNVSTLLGAGLTAALAYSHGIFILITGLYVSRMATATAPLLTLGSTGGCRRGIGLDGAPKRPVVRGPRPSL